MSKVIKIKWGKGLTTEQWEIKRSEIEGIGNLDVTRIGASDISVVTGSNKWKCPQRLFHHLTGFHYSFMLTEKLISGHLSEPIIIKRWESYVHGDEYQSLLNVRNNVRVRKAKKADFFIINDKYPNLFASLDYVPLGKQYSPFTGELYKPLTPIELKTTSEQYYRMWTNGIAQQYLEQVHGQMMLSNTEVTIFNTLLDGVKYKVMEVERDNELCEFIDFKSRAFADIVAIGKVCVDGMRQAKELGDEAMWENFKAMYDDVTPEAIGMDSDKNGDNVLLANELFPEDNGLFKSASEQDDYLMSQYLKCNDVSKKIGIRKDEIKAKLLLSCEDFEGIESDNYKMINRRATDFKKAYFSIKSK